MFARKFHANNNQPAADNYPVVGGDDSYSMASTGYDESLKNISGGRIL
jgi:hypothetical protein